MALNHADQRALHEVYRPSQDLTERQLEAELEISKHLPAETQRRAGQAFVEIKRIHRMVTTTSEGEERFVNQILNAYVRRQTTTSRKGQHKHQVSISSLARDTSSKQYVRDLANVVIAIAKDLAREEQDRRKAESDLTDQPADDQADAA